MIWVPVILLASVIGYLKRENLYMLYDTRYWAAAAMVNLCVRMCMHACMFSFSLDLDLCDDIWADVESNSRTSFCSSKSTDWRNGEPWTQSCRVPYQGLSHYSLSPVTSFRVTSVVRANTSSLQRRTLSLHCVSSLTVLFSQVFIKFLDLTV